MSSPRCKPQPQRNSVLLPSPISVVHKNAQRPRLLPEPSRQSGAGHGKSLARQERYGTVLRSSGLGAAIRWPDTVVLSIGIDWGPSYKYLQQQQQKWPSPSPSPCPCPDIKAQPLVFEAALAALTGHAVRISGDASAAYFSPPPRTTSTVSGNSLIAW
jgi:hypothetical protein